MKQTLFTLALCLIFPIGGYAFHPPVRNFSRKTYNAGTQNWCITQNDGNCIYIANNDGILEFDGSEWTRYFIVNGTNVRSVYFDTETSRVYAGSSGELGCLEIADGRRMRYTSLLDGLDINVTEIWDILKLEGGLFFRDNACLFRLDSAGLKQYPFNGGINCSAMLHGRLFVFSERQGLQVLSGDVFKPVSGSEGLRGKHVCTMLEYGDDILLVTEADGLYRWDGRILTRPDIPLNRMIAGEILFCAAADEHHLALGSVSNGVFILDRDSRSTLHLNLSSGLQNNTVLSMKFDNTGNLWLGLDKGVDYVLLNSPELPLFSDSDVYGAGYASAQYAGKLYLGTNQGLYCLPRPDHYPLQESDLSRVQAVPAVKGQVWNLTVIGDALFCCTDKGLHIFYPDGSRDDLSMNGVWKVEALGASPDAVIGSTYDRMFILRKRSGRWQDPDELTGFGVGSKTFEEDFDGQIWFSDWIKGIYRLTLNADLSGFSKVELFSSREGFPARHIIPNKTADGMVFSTEAGFFRFDGIRGRAEPIPALNALLSCPKIAMNIFEFGNGVRYFSSARSQTIEYPDLRGNRILDSLSLRYLCGKRKPGFDNLLQLSPNQLLINTEDGFSILNLERLRNHRASKPSRVFIKNIYLTKGTVDEPLFVSKKPVEDAVLRLSPKQNSLRFEFVCPDFSGEEGSEYSWMLENYDADWTDFGSVESKEYTKLDAGKYVFRIRARGRFGDNASATALTVLIAPPFYRTSFAWFLYALLLTGLVYVCHRLILRKSERRAEKIARKKEEEMKKAQLKNDLEHKAQDLAASTMNVIRKNEILMKIDSDIDRMTAYMNSEEEKNKVLRVLKNIRREIKENIEHDNDWKKFEKNFDVVYNDFLHRLGESYPKLSEGDKKLSAYLKMGLCSKEIAPLLNMTVRSVEMTRHRLRRKLDLGRKTNLTDFLQHF